MKKKNIHRIKRYQKQHIRQCNPNKMKEFFNRPIVMEYTILPHGININDLK